MRPERVLSPVVKVGADAVVAVQVFCRRMHDEIGAEGQRTSFSTGVAAVPSTAGSAPAAPAMSIHSPQRIRGVSIHRRRVRPGRTTRRSASSDGHREGDVDARGLGKVLQPAAQTPIHDLRSCDMSVRSSARGDAGYRNRVETSSRYGPATRRHRSSRRSSQAPAPRALRGGVIRRSSPSPSVYAHVLVVPDREPQTAP